MYCILRVLVLELQLGHILRCTEEMVYGRNITSKISPAKYCQQNIAMSQLGRRCHDDEKRYEGYEGLRSI